MVDDDVSLAGALTDAAGAIHATRPLSETLGAILDALLRAIPGFDHAGISIRHADGIIETLSATDQLVHDLDAAQYSIDEGPCVDAIEGGQVVVAENLEDDPRWPAYLPVAIELGLRAQMGVVLAVDGERFGGLNLYSTTSRRVDKEATQVAQLFATHAALALGWVKHDEMMSEALTTRKTIGQAAGIIMERFQVDEDRAFHFLLHASSTSNTKLLDVARQLVDEANSKGISQ